MEMHVTSRGNTRNKQGQHATGVSIQRPIHRLADAASSSESFKATNESATADSGETRGGGANIALFAKSPNNE